jgi:hypothetical protein
MTDNRERAISLIASIILCTCLASSVSLIARDALDVTVRPAATSDSFYGAQSVSSMFEVKAERRGMPSALDTKVVAKAVRPGATLGPGGPDVRQGETVASPDGNALAGSAALLVMSVLAVAATALAGVAIVALRLRSSQADGRPEQCRSYVELDETGRPSVEAQLPSTTEHVGV